MVKLEPVVWAVWQTHRQVMWGLYLAVATAPPAGLPQVVVAVVLPVRRAKAATEAILQPAALEAEGVH
jgi:hypothetical protein